ncbi:hypothetical protein Plhal703r1_c71g0171221 [Plasmopara halstedii]
MIAIRRAAAVTSKCTFVAPTQVLGFPLSRTRKKPLRLSTLSMLLQNLKQDEKTLRKLLQKMKGQTDVTDKEGNSGLKLNDEQVQALLKWKHQH